MLPLIVLRSWGDNQSGADQVLIRRLLIDCRAQEVRVADNPIESPADCFAKTGIKKAVEKAAVRINLPYGNAFRILQTPGAELISELAVFLPADDRGDKVIGVAPAEIAGSVWRFHGYKKLVRFAGQDSETSFIRIFTSLLPIFQ